VKLFGLEIRRAALASPVHDNRGGWWPVVREPFMGAWQRNREWTSDSVLAHETVYACVTLIASDVGKLRPKLMEEGEGGVWQEVRNTAHSPVLAKPNRYQNHIQFKEAWLHSKLIHGNAYVLLRRDARGVVNAMYLLSPNRVKPLVAPDGEVFYELQADNLAGQQEQVAVPASEIIHDRMNALYHPLVGTSPIFAAGTAAHMGLAIQHNSSAFFGNGSNPSGLLSTPVTITPQKARELSEVWNTQYGGENAGRVAVLGDGMKFEAMRMSAVDSQLIDQLRWGAEAICRAFHVPPFKLGIGPQASYQNPETLNGIYYSDCLQTHIESWELGMDEALGLTRPIDGRRLGVELDLDGLLRMDAASQMKTLSDGVGGAILTPNEARAKLDRPPIVGGDTVYLQQQNYSLAALDERDRENPLKPEPAALPAPPAPAALPPGEERSAQRRFERRLVELLTR
jgi:HK97 family phage portal protein